MLVESIYLVPRNQENNYCRNLAPMLHLFRSHVASHVQLFRKGIDDDQIQDFDRSVD